MVDPKLAAGTITALVAEHGAGLVVIFDHPQPGTDMVNAHMGGCPDIGPKEVVEALRALADQVEQRDKAGQN